MYHHLEVKTTYLSQFKISHFNVLQLHILRHMIAVDFKAYYSSWNTAYFKAYDCSTFKVFDSCIF